MNKNFLVTLALFIFAVAAVSRLPTNFASDASASVKYFQESEPFTPVVDTYVASGPNSQGDPRGDRNGLFVGYDDDPDFDYRQTRTFLQFDLTSLANKVATGPATLSLYLTFVTFEFPGQMMNIQLHEVTGELNNETIWNNQPEYVPNFITSQDVGTEFDRWIEWTIPQHVIQDWINRSELNIGIALVSPEGEMPGKHLRNFRSKEYENGSHPPQLEVSYTEPPPTPTSTPTNTPTNTPTSTPTPTPTPTPVPLTISLKNDPPGAVEMGDPITYTITYGNISATNPLTLTDVVVRGYIPTGTTYVPDSASIMTPTQEQEGKLVWKVPDLKPDQQQQQITYTVGVGGVADLEVSTTAPPTVTAGSELTYTLIITNHGPSPATGIVLKNILSPYVTYKNHDNHLCNNNDWPTTQLFVCKFNLSDSDSDNETILLTVSVDDDWSGQVITNTVSVRANQYDPNDGNNSATSETSIEQSEADPAEVDLAINKAVTPTMVMAGDYLTYTITLTKTASSAISNVTFTDTLPLSLTYDSITPNNYEECKHESPDVICRVGMETKNEISKTLVVRVSPIATGRFTNTVKVEELENDSNPNNNISSAGTELIRVVNGVDLAVDKRAEPSVNPSDELTYTLTIRNLGDITGTNVILTDTLPNQVTVSRIVTDSDHITCHEDDNKVSCNLGDVVGGQQISAKIVISVPQTIALQAITNTVEITTSTSIDQNPNNNWDTTTTIVNRGNSSIREPWRQLLLEQDPISTHYLVEPTAPRQEGNESLLITNWAEAISEQTGVIRSNNVFNAEVTLYLPVIFR